MTKFTLRSLKPVRYSSVRHCKSAVMPGVEYALRRVSLAQRIELARRAQELAAKYEFLKAGDSADQLEASIADLLVRRLYLEWGISSISGMTVDGRSAAISDVIEKGPEVLTDEMMGAIKEELGLTDDERKNS